MNVMKTPRSVDILITSNCNLRCRYCGFFSSEGDVHYDLAKEEWLQFFKELKECAVLDVTIQGGEPFYREDIVDIIEGIIQNKMRFTILSNATLIRDEIASYLANTRRCNGVQVSLDGAEPTDHDIFRGVGTFDNAIEGLQILLKHKVPTTVRVTIHKHNYNNLPEIAQFLLEDLGLHSFSTNSASYFGLCRQFSEQVQMTTEDMSIAMEILMDLNKKYSGRIQAQAGPLYNAKNWTLMKQAKDNHLPINPESGGHLLSCGCPMLSISVRSDGIIIPCSQLSHIQLGRINVDNLQHIWNNHPELKKIRSRKYIPLNNFEFCQGCEYMNYCKGGCPALSYTLLGKVDHPSPDVCLKRFLAQNGRLPNKELLATAIY
ncbi:MAG: SynChlorMet cassette radical SAM/SPASM protein ScmE [Leptospiraceae bacterium]|nr:SynChlorMet cassette radical SAM/SPASM protein ScmE [Leptospiraceae bacterium]